MVLGYILRLSWSTCRMRLLVALCYILFQTIAGVFGWCWSVLDWLFNVQMYVLWPIRGQVFIFLFLLSRPSCYSCHPTSHYFSMIWTRPHLFQCNHTLLEMYSQYKQALWWLIYQYSSILNWPLQRTLSWASSVCWVRVITSSCISMLSISMYNADKWVQPKFLTRDSNGHRVWYEQFSCLHSQ